MSAVYFNAEEINQILQLNEYQRKFSSSVGCCVEKKEKAAQKKINLTKEKKLNEDRFS